MSLSILFPQQHTYQCTIKEIEDVTVSQSKKRLLQRTGDEIIDVIVPQTLEEIGYRASGARPNRSWTYQDHMSWRISWKLSICSHSDASR